MLIADRPGEKRRKSTIAALHEGIGLSERADREICVPGSRKDQA